MYGWTGPTVQYLPRSQVIISGLSSPEVLTVDGFVNYARAVGLYDCLSQSPWSPLIIHPAARPNVWASILAGLSWLISATAMAGSAKQYAVGRRALSLC